MSSAMDISWNATPGPLNHSQLPSTGSGQHITPSVLQMHATGLDSHITNLNCNAAQDKLTHLDNHSVLVNINSNTVSSYSSLASLPHDTSRHHSLSSPHVNLPLIHTLPYSPSQFPAYMHQLLLSNFLFDETPPLTFIFMVHLFLLPQGPQGLFSTATTSLHCTYCSSSPFCSTCCTPCCTPISSLHSSTRICASFLYTVWTATAISSFPFSSLFIFSPFSPYY